MSRLVVIAAAGLAAGLFLALAAETNNFLGFLMGVVLGSTSAVAAYAFPLDLDYRERRIWPPRAR